MKLICTFCFVVLLVACKNPDTSSKAVSKSFDANLLVGDWQRTNDSENKKTYESWWLSSNGIPEGKGYTMLNSDTIWSEKIAINLIGGYKNLVVKDKTNVETAFKFISETKNSFKCHNPTNEFPKFIEYIVSEYKIKAVISDGENSIDFLFDRE